MLSLDRLWVHSAKARLWRWLLGEFVHAPIEPILHPSATRLRWAGFSVFFGNLIFYAIWTVVVRQPYESLFLRIVAACSGALLFLPIISRDSSSYRGAWLYSAVCWLVMPVFFFWMYWMNGGNAVWLASISAMFLIYYHMTDWRLATVGSTTGALLSWLVFNAMRAPVEASASFSIENLVVIGFAWGTAFVLGFSSANLRRTRLINTLSTMAVMAHELRTPLATVDLLGDVLRNQAQHEMPEHKQKKIEDLATRLQNLVRSMNRQIDTQISNAQLLRLPNEKSPVHAAELVRDVVANYPYRSSHERDCVEAFVQQDFCFMGSRALFSQLLSNLIKNALYSLAASSHASHPGDLRITVGVYHGKGRLAVADKGLGIPHEHQQRIFEPFFSTQTGVGSGLGLTFCKNVVETVKGHIGVFSEPGEGAVFVIDLPMHTATAPERAPSS